MTFPYCVTRGEASAASLRQERFRFARALAKELWCNEAQVRNLVDSRVEQSSVELLELRLEMEMIIFDQGLK